MSHFTFLLYFILALQQCSYFFFKSNCDGKVCLTDVFQQTPGLETNATSINSTVGVVALVAGNYPQIAAVGMAASEGREPRIVDIRWDAPTTGALETAPEIVIIGKGITFDTGGLNIKGGGGMRNMKRDMAGAAQALSLALRIVEMKLPVKLRLLLPIAENSISGIALRPGAYRMLPFIIHPS